MSGPMRPLKTHQELFSPKKKSSAFINSHVQGHTIVFEPIFAGSQTLDIVSRLLHDSNDQKYPESGPFECCCLLRELIRAIITLKQQ